MIAPREKFNSSSLDQIILFRCLIRSLIKSFTTSVLLEITVFLEIYLKFENIETRLLSSKHRYRVWPDCIATQVEDL